MGGELGAYSKWSWTERRDDFLTEYLLRIEVILE